MTCLFCQIANGETAASIVHKDRTTLAFMNLRQMNPGHVLVIPRGHYATVDQLDPDVAGDLFKTVVKVARAIEHTFHPDGLTIWQSNGTAAGQEIDHVHIHVLPRRLDDDLIGFYRTAPPMPNRAALDALAARLRAVLRT